MKKHSARTTRSKFSKKESNGQVEKRERPPQKILSSLYRKWGLARRLEHRKVKEKRK